jgi:hypothetical protein
MQRFEVSEYMNTSSSIQVSGLEEPQVVALEVAHGHAVLGGCPLLEVESLELGHLIHALSRCRTHRVLILVVEEIKEFFLFAGHGIAILPRVLLFTKPARVCVALGIFLVLSDTLLDLLDAVLVLLEGLIVGDEWRHDLVIELRLVDFVDFHVEGDGEADVENVFLRRIAVPRELSEQTGLLCYHVVKLDVINHLLDVAILKLLIPSGPGARQLAVILSRLSGGSPSTPTSGEIIDP